MVQFTDLVEDEEDDEFVPGEPQVGAPIDRSQSEGEITRYHDIELMSPESWKQIPDELRLQTALMFETDREAQAQIASKKLPEGYTVEWDEEGQQAYVRDPDGKVGVINEAGPSVKDVTEVVGNALPYMGLNPLKYGSAATTGTAMGIEALRQQYSNFEGAETRRDNQIPGLDLMDLGLAGVTQAVPDYLTNKATLDKYAPMSRTMDHFNSRLSENLDTLNAGGWMQGLRGQVAESGPEAQELRMLGNLEHSAPDARHTFQMQNEEALERVGALTETPADSVNIPGQVQRQTENLRGGLVNRRQSAAGPLYDRAYSDTVTHSAEPMIDQIGQVRMNYAPETKVDNTLARLQNLLGDRPLVNGEPSPPDELTIQEIHSVKKELDDQVETALRSGDNNLARELTQVKESLLGFTEKINTDYGRARRTFRRLSGPIDQFDDSLAGTIREMDPSQSHKLGEMVFKPSISPSQRADLKMKLDSVDPELYGDFARTEMQRRLAKIRDVSPDDLPNVPYQLNNALFPNSQTRDMWKEALPDQADNIENLYRGLKIYSRARSMGSATAANQASRDALSGTSLNTSADLAKELMEWLTVIPKMTQHGLSGINRRTAGRRQSQAMQNQRDLTGPYGGPTGATQAELEARYPTLAYIIGLGQGVRTELSED